MLAIKKYAQQKLALLHFAVVLLLLISCGKHVFEEPDYLALANVEFCNDSSYKVIIHQTDFGGPVLAELRPAQCISMHISPSNNYGIGTVFSIEYWHWLENEVWVGGKDPDRQITRNLEAGESYSISIPQPKNLDLHESFIKILNVSVMDLELNCLSQVLYSVSNELPVPSNKSGLYSVKDMESSSCFNDGEIKNLTVTQGLTNRYPFPEFTVDEGYIYNFKFDGNMVIQTENEKII